VDVHAQAVGYPTLFLLVMIGAFLPVIPTGAIVSASAVVAWKQHPLFVLLVVAVSAVAALIGDLALFGLTSSGTRWWRHRSMRPAAGHDELRRRLERHQVGVLVLSRLIPGGRIPVLVAAAGIGLTVRRLARGSAVACLAWAACYASLGAFGGALFPEPWQGVLAAVVLVVLLLLVLRLVARHRSVRSVLPP
jgi:membrane protein DedA with SNARE-associated domain